MSLKLSSEAVINGKMNDKYGDRCKPEDMIYNIPQISFPLTWEGVPSGTESLAIVFMDYDNAESEGFPFVHWLVADIPADWSGLKENCSIEGGDFVQGTNSWSTIFGPYEDIPREFSLRFGGPAPGEVQHEYEVTLYALDKKLEMAPGFYFNQLRKAMRGHILAETTMYALY